MPDQSLELPLEKIFWTIPIRPEVTKQDIINRGVSLRCHGQIHDVVVKPANEKGLYEGVTGRVTYEGAKHAHIQTVRARIHEFESKVEEEEWQLVENLHRVSMPAMSKAQSYKRLFEEMRKKLGDSVKRESIITAMACRIEDLSGETVSEKTIGHYLNLAENLAPKAQEILTSEKMGLRHGLELLRLKDKKKQLSMAKKAADQKWPVERLKSDVAYELQQERSERHKKRVEEKAEELRSQGKIVYTSYASWKDREGTHEFWGDFSEPCASCDRKGILIQANFRQEPLCVDDNCYKKTQEERRNRERAQEEAGEAKFRTERAKIYAMDPDIRHWRLALYGLVDDWELRTMLGISRDEYEPGSLAGAVWNKILELPEDEVKRLLIRHAVESVMTGPQAWRGERDVKEWAVKEWRLDRSLFLREEEEKP